MTFGWPLRCTSPIFLLLLMAIPGSAQQIIISSKGERIVIYPDGSWRLAEPRDSLLVKQYLQRTQKVDAKEEITNHRKERNQGEEQEYISRQWNELYNTILAEEKQVQRNFRLATNAQFKAAEQLRNAEQNKRLIEPDHLASLHDAYNHSVQQLKSAKLRQKKIQSLLEKAHKLNSAPLTVNEKNLTKHRSRYSIYLSTYDPGKAQLFASAPPIKKSTEKNIQTPSPSVVSNTSNLPKSTGISHPLVLPDHRKPRSYAAEPKQCVFHIDSEDEATGRRRLELEPDMLFSYTDPDLRPYFKDKDLMTCMGYLSKIGPYLYLTIDFQIASSHSQSNFGSLAHGSLVRLKLLDGEYVSLYNLKSDRGRIDPYSGHTLFSGQYALGKHELKKLSGAELDKMRVVWGTGYEDYEVYYVDFFKNQLECILSKK